MSTTPPAGPSPTMAEVAEEVRIVLSAVAAEIRKLRPALDRMSHEMMLTMIELRRLEPRSPDE